MATHTNKRDGLPTGSNTSGARDVADPHPANVEHYDRQEHPGGSHPPQNDLGPNDAIDDGRPAPRPRNAPK